MKKIKVFHDTRGNTLTIWFDDPQKESICEELEGDFVIMKDKNGKVIGFEKLNYMPASFKEQLAPPIEFVAA